MKDYNVKLTEDEMLFIRAALCDKNLKLVNKMYACKNAGNDDEWEFFKDRYDFGHELFRKLEILRDSEN